MYAFGEFETVSNPGSNREKGTPPMKKKNIPASVASTNAYEGLEDWARSRVQVWLQELLEDEVTQFLGREKSERSPNRRGYRNGHGKPRRFAMMNGTMEVRRPRVRNTAERFESQILPYFRRKSKQLGELGVIARFVPEITLREELANNWTAEHYARFLAGLRCNGRALVRSAAPEFQLKSPVRMMWSQPRGETCLSNSGSGSRPFRRR